MVIDKKAVGFARDCHPPKNRQFSASEVFQLPRAWAEALLASDFSVCDLTPKALFGPFGGPSMPRSLLRRFLPQGPMPDWRLRLLVTGAASESTHFVLPGASARAVK